MLATLSVAPIDKPLRKRRSIKFTKFPTVLIMVESPLVACEQ